MFSGWSYFLLALAAGSAHALPPWRPRQIHETILDVVSVVHTDTYTKTVTLLPGAAATASAAVELLGDVSDPVLNANAQGVFFLPGSDGPVPAAASSVTTTTGLTGSVDAPSVPAGPGSVPVPPPSPAPFVSSLSTVSNPLVSASASASALFPISVSPAGVSDAVPGAINVNATALPVPVTDPSPPQLSPTTNGNDTSPFVDSNNNGTDGSATVGPAFAPARTIVPIHGPLIAAYYPDWVASTLPPEAIDFTRLDWLDFAFAIPAADFSLTWDDPQGGPALLKRLVAAAHAKHVNVKLSIGGWDGSKYFSPAVATASSRKTFVANIVSVYNQYSLDGIDIDWEYPGQQGEGANKVSPQDSANFLLFLQALRSALPASARITAAVQDTPFADANGNPMRDVSAFANVLDWVNIMNYDVFGSGAIPGPNAPLKNGCGDSSQPSANAAAAIQTWTNAKFPAGRLMLGVPFYGYLSRSEATSLQHKRKRSLKRQVVAEASPVTMAVTSTSTSTDTSSSSLEVETDTSETQVQSTSTMQEVSSSVITTSDSETATGEPYTSSFLIMDTAASEESTVESISTSTASPPLSSPISPISESVTDTTSTDNGGKAASPSAATSANPQLATLISSDNSPSSGQIQFSALVAQGALLRAMLAPAPPSPSGGAPLGPNSEYGANGTAAFVAAGGFARLWDACSTTPFLVSLFSNQVVTYDDPVSLGAKAFFARQQNVLGTAVWDISGDTAQWDLLNALRVGLGKPL